MFLPYLVIKTLAADEDGAYSNVFKTYSVEYASDPRFKIEGARENIALHLES